MKRNGRKNYGQWFSNVEGALQKWENLSDRQLANLYNFFMSKINADFIYQKIYDGALDWIKKEAERRHITNLLKNTEEYGSYPYIYEGRWMVFDRDCLKDIALVDYDWNKLPPDVVDEMRVMKMLGLIK